MSGSVKIFYRDESVDTDLDGTENGTIRIYQDRTDMDLVCLMKGKMPQAKNEIAIDRMYADNNSLTVGDKIKVGGEELSITGLIALSDYSCLFSNNSDMMFDAVKFGVAIMTEEGLTSSALPIWNTAIPGSTPMSPRMTSKPKTCPRISLIFL